jgi:FHA domain
MVMHVFTKTDSVTHEWAIDDQVIRLRQWGTDTIYMLPSSSTDECTIGAADTCTIRLNDPTGRASRMHARIVRHETKWLLRDAGSKNGVRVDGARRHEIVLEPGLEIGIGGLTLHAESNLSIALRGFVARLLGWRSDRADPVDHALRAIRMGATRQVALVLCGDGDLVRTARSIHRRSRGSKVPFIVCDPRRPRGHANVRNAEHHATGMEALEAAAGGTVCVRERWLPPDMTELMEALHAPESSVQLMMCAQTREQCEKFRLMPIVIPPLSSRIDEIDQIIDEYAADAMTELMLPRSTFPPVDRAWVREHACTSLPDIEKAALRLVALRASRNLGETAARLGMARSSLVEWIDRRQLPMEIVP